MANKLRITYGYVSKAILDKGCFTIRVHQLVSFGEVFQMGLILMLMYCMQVE